MHKSLSRGFRSKTPVRVAYALIIMMLMMGASGSYSPSSKANNSPADTAIVTDTWAVQVLPGTDPDVLARSLGAKNLGQIGSLTDYYLFQLAGSDTNTESATSSLSAQGQVIWFEQQVARQQNKRAYPPTDPLYSTQWHLNNAAVGGVDINVLPAWSGGTTGSGVTIAIVDDGLQLTHPDLSAQYVAAASWDFNGNDSVPAADPAADKHGTALAGIATANDNSTCGVGVAYDASLSGLRLLAGPVTDALEASALTYAGNTNSIYSNSWGPADDGADLRLPGPLTLAALESGVTNGRSGKGSIYVWAAGNGLLNNDNVNYDGYANSRYTIAVGAVDDLGEQANYSEPGAALLVTAPSISSGRPGITTTDLLGTDGFNTASSPTGDCVTNFNSDVDDTRGTSSAAAIVSGVTALMLQANPNLGWRDVQHILAQSAFKNDPTDADWDVNGAGMDINHKYGFGMVDAGEAVTAAKTWINVGPQAAFSSGSILVNQPIPDNDPGGLTTNFVVNQPIKLEHVEVVFTTIGHTYRGELEIVLTSPSGTQSVLAARHEEDVNDDYTAWKFMTVRNWGESSVGNWSLKVVDTAGGDFGDLASWQLNLYGTYPSGSNDAIADASTITGIPYLSIVDTTAATTAVDDPTVPACGLNKGLNSVWYSYTPTATKTAYFDTYGSTYNTFIAVWTGTPGALTPVTCNNDSASTTQSAVSFTATASTKYYIEVAQYNGTIAAPNAPAVETLPAASGGILKFHGTSFSDVPGNYWAWNFIEGLYKAGITGGCGTGTYCPGNPVTRSQMAVFLLRGIHGSSYVPPAVGASTGFADVPINYPTAAWIKQLAAEGITGGCDLQNYCPEKIVTRDQMAIFLLRSKYTSTYAPPDATGIFLDVPTNYWAAKWIEQLSLEGITGGCGNGNYCPGNNVTRDQMAIFLDRTFGLPSLP